MNGVSRPAAYLPSVRARPPSELPRSPGSPPWPAGRVRAGTPAPPHPARVLNRTPGLDLAPGRRRPRVPSSGRGTFARARLDPPRLGNGVHGRGEHSASRSEFPPGPGLRCPTRWSGRERCSGLAQETGIRQETPWALRPLPLLTRLGGAGQTISGTRHPGGPLILFPARPENFAQQVATARAAGPPASGGDYHHGLRGRVDSQADRQPCATPTVVVADAGPAHRPAGNSKCPPPHPDTRSPCCEADSHWPTWGFMPRSPVSSTRRPPAASGCSSSATPDPGGPASWSSLYQLIPRLHA